jgi:cytochrome c oxidase cbb3-type subunit III
MRRQKFILLLIPVVITLSACQRKRAVSPANQFLNAYDVEQNSTDPQHSIPLNYQQAQGKRLFNGKCVWCHADATSAGPSNRSNLSPTPPLFTDGETFNLLSDDFMRNTITLGGGAMGKSTIMPPWGQTLTQDEIRALITYERAVAQPPYKPSARPPSQYSEKEK